MSNQYLILKNCNKIRSWLTTRAFNFTQSNHHNVLDVNIPLDIMNLNFFKNTNIKKYTVLTYQQYMYDIYHDKYKNFKILKNNHNNLKDYINNESDIFYFIHTLNSPEFDMMLFEDIIQKFSQESFKNCLIIGSIYNKEYIENNSVNNIYKDKFTYIELNDISSVMLSYNLYSGNKVENKVKLVSITCIQSLIDKYDNLTLEVHQYKDICDTLELNLNDETDSFSKLRTAYIIKHIL